MEKKTNLFEEFGSLSNPSTREPDNSPAGLDIRSDPNSEFYQPPDPFKTADAGTSTPSSRPKRRNQKARHRLSLLLQVAAAGLGVVLVGNSFGRDILNEGVFEDTPDSSQTDDAPAGAGSLYITRTGNSTPVHLVQNGQVTDVADQIKGLSYDPKTNTLTLQNYNGGKIVADSMGDDFTIDYTDDCSVQSIYSQGSSLTISGSFEHTLTVNGNSQEPVGILLAAEGQGKVLTIDWNSDIVVYGTDSAILVRDTTAAQGISLLPVSLASGDVVSSGDGDGTDWYISQSTGNNSMAAYARIEPAFMMSHTGHTDDVTGPFTLYRGAPYGNPGVTELKFNDYGTFRRSDDYSIVVTNKSANPVYIYLQQYTMRNESTPVDIVIDGDWENTQERDMQGEYFCYGGVSYLATDGASLFWKEEAVINGDTIPSDALLLEAGESVTFTLPDDGSDSIYTLFAETYYPELDYYWWLRYILGFSGT